MDGRYDNLPSVEDLYPVDPLIFPDPPKLCDHQLSDKEWEVVHCYHDIDNDAMIAERTGLTAGRIQMMTQEAWFDAAIELVTKARTRKAKLRLSRAAPKVVDKFLAVALDGEKTAPGNVGAMKMCFDFMGMTGKAGKLDLNLEEHKKKSGKKEDSHKGKSDEELLEMFGDS